MYKTVLNFLDTGYKFNSTGGTEQMSNHRFCGIDFHIICVTAKSEFDRTRFKQVVVMRGCSMCIDVGNFFRTDACIFHRIGHGTGCTGTILSRGSNVVCIR